MAKVDLANLAPGATVLSRGRILIRDTPFGGVAQKWPRKRGRATSGYDFYRQAEFGWASRAAASPIDLDLLTATEMVKTTTYVPRDFLVMAAYGRAYEIQAPDGTIWENYRDVNNPQYMLDLLGDTVGAVIYRAEIGWVILPPASNGFVLTMEDGLPVWQAPSGGGGGAAPLITVLAVDVADAPVATANITCSFDSAPIDENGVWDPVTPTRLYIPPAAVRIRFTTAVKMTDSAVSNDYESRLVTDTAAVAWQGNPRQAQRYQTTTQVQKNWTASGVWIDNPGFDFVTLNVVMSSGITTAFQPATALMIECAF
jgi:hypothetical protein